MSEPTSSSSLEGKLRRGLLLEGDSSRQTNINGVPICVPKGCDHFLPASPHPLHYSFESALHAGLEATVQSGDIVFDLGATSGIHSVLMAHQVGPGGRVHLFDACPEAVKSARALAEANGVSDHIQFNPRFVCDHSGQDIDFYRLPGMLRPASSRDGGIQTGRAGIQRFSVRSISLDDYWSEEEAGPDCIKIDVEGSEFEVLLGARKLIEAHRPHLLVETHGQSIARIAGSLGELCRSLEHFGYQLYDLEEGDLVSAEVYSERRRNGIGYLMASDRLDDPRLLTRIGDRRLRAQELQAEVTSGLEALRHLKSQGTQGNSEGMREALLDLLERHPWSGEGHYLLAQQLRSQGEDLSNVLEAFEQARRCGYDEFWIQFSWASTCFERGEVDQARAAMEAALEHKPWHPEAQRIWQLALGTQVRTLVKREDFAPAIPLLRILREADPENGEWAYLLAFSMQMESFPGSTPLELFARALELGYDSFWVHYNRGFLLRKLGRTEEALADFRAAQSIEPDRKEISQQIAELTSEEI
ncbi:FkbM family methyltransferase [Myxococcota bacterium]|nr:FkbM family methyltransferase [Myxococcota bacterium]